MSVSVYVSEQEREQWYMLLAENGFIPTPRFGAALSKFMHELFTIPLSIVAPIEHSHTPRSNPNRVYLNIPEALANYPQRHQIQDWTDFVHNLILRNIVPSPPHDYPSIRSTYSSYVLPPSQMLHNWLTQTTLTQEIVEALLPIQAPLYYIDNRDIQVESVTTDLRNGVRYDISGTTSWIIPYLPKVPCFLSIDQPTMKALLEISEYYHIIPRSRRTKNSRLTLTLEALQHRLLVPRSTLASDS